MPLTRHMKSNLANPATNQDRTQLVAGTRAMHSAAHSGNVKYHFAPVSVVPWDQARAVSELQLDDREPDALVVVPCRGKGGFGTAALQTLIDGAAAMRVMRMDLASLQSVRDFVAELEAARLPPVKGLVCNAGLLQIQAPSVTADGFEVCVA